MTKMETGDEQQMRKYAVDRVIDAAESIGDVPMAEHLTVNRNTYLKDDRPVKPNNGFEPKKFLAKMKRSGSLRYCGCTKNARMRRWKPWTKKKGRITVQMYVCDRCGRQEKVETLKSTGKRTVTVMKESAD